MDWCAVYWERVRAEEKKLGRLLSYEERGTLYEIISKEAVESGKVESK